MLRKKFKPAQLAHQVLDTNPDQNQKTLAKNVHTVVSEEEEQQLMEKLLSLPRQGEIVQHFEGNAASWWAKSIGQLPLEPFCFVLNATLDTLPSNSNLNLWGKGTSTICPLCQERRQTLFHVLNACPKAMTLRRYSKRHDNVLKEIFVFISAHLQPSFSITSDLPDDHDT